MKKFLFLMGLVVFSFASESNEKLECEISLTDTISAKEYFDSHEGCLAWSSSVIELLKIDKEYGEGFKKVGEAIDKFSRLYKSSIREE